MKISVITPTADRPVGFALAERFMARQTMQPTEWIVADGGQVPATCTMGQIHVHDTRPAGAENLAHNLLNGIARAGGDVIVIWEDDDHYAPTHIETLIETLARPNALLAGDSRQHYYNVAHRCWRVFDNIGASLCQTAMTREALPMFEIIIRECLARRTPGIDAALWRAAPRNRWAITGTHTVVGIKSLPGQAGLGIGHRPTGPKWTPDPNFIQLRASIGDDADLYSEYWSSAE